MSITPMPTGLWVVSLLAFTIPWGDMLPLLSGQPLTVSRVATLPVLLIWAAGNGRALEKPLAGRLHLVMGLFVLWAAASSLITLDPSSSLRRLLMYFQLSLDAWLVYIVASDSAAFRRLLQAFVCGCGVVCAGILASYLLERATGDLRYSAQGFDANDAAATAALGIPAACYLAHAGGSRLNHLYLPFAVVSAVLTGSRMGLLLLGWTCIYVLLAMGRPRARLVSAVLLLAAGLAGIGMLGQQTRDRLATIREQVEGRDLGGRFAIWQAGETLFRENPWTGIGAGAFRQSLEGRAGLAAQVAHNTFLEILVEHGLPGAACFLAVCAAAVAEVRRLAPPDRRLWIGLLLCWAVAASALSWENREISWLVLGLAAAHARAKGAEACCASSI